MRLKYSSVVGNSSRCSSTYCSDLSCDCSIDNLLPVRDNWYNESIIWYDSWPFAALVLNPYSCSNFLLSLLTVSLLTEQAAAISFLFKPAPVSISTIFLRSLTYRLVPRCLGVEVCSDSSGWSLGFRITFFKQLAQRSARGFACDPLRDATTHFALAHGADVTEQLGQCVEERPERSHRRLL